MEPQLLVVLVSPDMESVVDVAVCVVLGGHDTDMFEVSEFAARL